ncbi:MAG: hypothetical protein WC562_00900 [Dehalococcoidia bacterium]
MKLYSILAVLFITLILPIATLACSPQETNEESRFGVYLVDTGGLILSEHHIESYNSSSHEIELNAAGIEQWNSFVKSHDPGDWHASDIWCLHQKEFSVKMDGEEIYTGQFWSPLSSLMYEGVVIMYFPKLYDEFNTLWINSFQPDDNDPINDPRVIDFFAGEGLLEN